MKKAWAISWECNSGCGSVWVNDPNYKCGWAHHSIREIEIDDDEVADEHGVYYSHTDWYDEEGADEDY